jgi:hypothetical protein
MLAAELALVGIVLLTLRLLEWQPPRWILVSLIIFSLVSYYSLQSLVSATPTIFLVFIYLSILLALRSFNDELAGGLLFLGAYQWEVGALLFLFIFIIVFANKRWSVFTGFGMALFVMFVVSFLAYPGWLLPYTRAVLSDLYRGAALNFNSIFEFWYPGLQFSSGMIIAVALLILVFIEMIGAAREHFRRIVWVACLALAVTPLIGFPIFISNHTALLPAYILILLLAFERWNRRQTFASATFLVVGYLTPIGLYVASHTTQSRAYADLLTVFPPIATIVALYWMRWFAVRSPRTWLDQVGLRK